MYKTMKECPICHELTPESSMIWVNGLNKCKNCYKEQVRQHREEQQNEEKN